MSADTIDPASYVKPHDIEDDALDGYARRGVVLSRDAASLVIAALYRDAYAMRERGGEPNMRGADQNEALAEAIGRTVTGITS